MGEVYLGSNMSGGCLWDPLVADLRNVSVPQLVNESLNGLNSHEQVGLGVLLLTFCGLTMFGNILVLVAVVKEHYLHTVTNYFIMSLAVADCLVGFLVMPFSAIEILANGWIFGPDWCDLWHSFDVLASTASILNLCVISMDRYWAITDPFSYPTRMSPRRAFAFIGLVWVCSSLISFPAIAWWRASSPTTTWPAVERNCSSHDFPSDQLNLPDLQWRCPFTEDVGYLVFSSCISFYGPLFVMVFTYCRIYRAAVEQTRSLKLGSKQIISNGYNGDNVELTLRIHRGGRNNAGRNHHYQSVPSSVSTLSSATSGDALASPSISNLGSVALAGGVAMVGMSTLGRASQSQFTVASNTKTNFSISRKLAKIAKERKAAKTLGIVMGVFVVCWLPFFVLNLLSGICYECIAEPERVVPIVTWLGWINSSMNPVIYACWSRDFRRAFGRLLCGCCPRKYSRRRQHHDSQQRNHPNAVSAANTPGSPVAATLSYSSICQDLYPV